MLGRVKQFVRDVNDVTFCPCVTGKDLKGC